MNVDIEDQIVESADLFYSLMHNGLRFSYVHVD